MLRYIRYAESKEKERVCIHVRESYIRVPIPIVSHTYLPLACLLLLLNLWPDLTIDSLCLLFSIHTLLFP